MDAANEPGEGAARGALRVTALSASGFRNLAPLQLSPGPRFNVIHGDNGQGKSNLLEALYYLAALRSFRGAGNRDLIAEGAEQAQLRARISGPAAPHQHQLLLRRNGGRLLQLDGKRPRSLSAYYAALQMVIFHPGDMHMVSGPPELRRGYLDRILEQFDATFAATAQAYQKALRSRNRLLRAPSPNRGAIAAYDELLASAGAVIGQCRLRLLSEMAQGVVEAFRSVSGEGLSLSLRYAARVEPEVAALRAALSEQLPRDLARGYTGDGPHADDLVFELGRSAAKHYGSQGQHRAIVLALKVAELHELERRVGRVPILLLDDVSSELDRGRNQRLFSLLSELGGQVFLTTTHPEHIQLSHDRVDYRVQAGVVELKADQGRDRGPISG
ncbi:MAG: DNA replication/repair protein RecF [Myxococcales bacterium]|nr:DNA replication/repair protein RecF [Myxococcales bacterium]